MKAANPFSHSTKGRTQFTSMYDAGNIPCRIRHGGSTKSNKVQWDIPMDAVQYMSVLPALAEGIREKVHPHAFIARAGFKDLMEHIGKERAMTQLDKVVRGIRQALMDKDPTVFRAAMEATRITSSVCKDALNTHLKALLMQISKKALKSKFKDDVTLTLQTLEENGGPPALKQIKAKVPTYTTVFI